MNQATPDEEAMLLAFMRQYEPVEVVPAARVRVNARAEAACRCGRPVSRPGALCIPCGNTAWLGQNTALMPIPEEYRLSAGT